MENLIALAEQHCVVDKKNYPDFKPGDTIIVSIKIKEGNKERIQKFQGIVLRRKNINTNSETFSVRKISNGVGVEKIFPIISPSIDNIEIVRRGSVRRSKLYYLRGKYGKSSSVKEKRIITDKSKS